MSWTPRQKFIVWFRKYLDTKLNAGELNSLRWSYYSVREAFEAGYRLAKNEDKEII